MNPGITLKTSILLLSVLLPAMNSIARFGPCPNQPTTKSILHPT